MRKANYHVMFRRAFDADITQCIEPVITLDEGEVNTKTPHFFLQGKKGRLITSGNPEVNLFLFRNKLYGVIKIGSKTPGGFTGAGHIDLIATKYILLGRVKNESE